MTQPISLIDAILEDDVASIDDAIAAGADVNVIPTSGHQPPLHVAIEHQRFEIVRRLILAGVKINRALSMPGCDLGDGWTPLTHAIDIESDAAWQAFHETGHESTALTELLLGSGAEPNSRAFQLAESYGNLKALELLRRYVGHPTIPKGLIE